MTRRGNVTQYGCIAVGCKVVMTDLVRAPWNAPVPLTSNTACSLARTGMVTNIDARDMSAIVTVRLDTGGTAQMSVNQYGQQHGGFGAVKVLRHAPTQARLQGMPA